MPKMIPVRSLLALAGVSLVVGAEAQTGAAVPAPARSFVEKAAAGGAAEVEGGKKEAESGKDPDIKAFAAKTLPTLQEHLKVAEATHAEVRKAKP